MIYCIGLRTKYERAFAAPGGAVKLGRGTGSDGRPYPGGWVWQSVAEARRFIAGNGLDATHEVYGVLADWERDAEMTPGDHTRRLSRDAPIVRLAGGPV
jgi:hypothetical protein